MTVIVPCCGESQRYNGTKKQLLILPGEIPLPLFSASCLKGAKEIIYTYLYEDIISMQKQHGTKINRLCLLGDQTESQVDTIKQTILYCDLQEEPIYIKDCDNYFETDIKANCVTVKHIRGADFKLDNKSYTLAAPGGRVLHMAERQQISKYVNVGGYGFESGSLFLEYCAGKKYVSEVILAAMASGVAFRINHCDNYIDYGEQDDFDRFMLNYDQLTTR